MCRYMFMCFILTSLHDEPGLDVLVLTRQVHCPDDEADVTKKKMLRAEQYWISDRYQSKLKSPVAALVRN